MKLNEENLVGKVFNDWTILNFSHNIKYNKYYNCLCNICKNEKIVYIQNITKGKSKNCGCTKKNIGEKSKKHNEYYIDNNIVYIKMSNCEEYMLCNIDDWNKLKQYCWSKNKYGYAIAYFDKKSRVLAHRKIFGIIDRNIQVDHINGKKLDNRKINLRLCNNQKNSFNRLKNSNNTSGYKGVYFDKERNKWRGVIQFNNKSIKSPKRYNTPEEAYSWYKIKSDEYFKEFSVFNVIRGEENKY